MYIENIGRNTAETCKTLLHTIILALIRPPRPSIMPETPQDSCTLRSLDSKYRFSAQFEEWKRRRRKQQDARNASSFSCSTLQTAQKTVIGTLYFLNAYVELYFNSNHEAAFGSIRNPGSRIPDLDRIPLMRSLWLVILISYTAPIWQPCVFTFFTRRASEHLNKVASGFKHRKNCVLITRHSRTSSPVGVPRLIANRDLPISIPGSWCKRLIAN